MPEITEFAIRGLYDERDIVIPFDSNIQVLVAENGYGKTTVLNALYATLSGDVSRLRRIPCSRIEISFDDGESFVVNKEDLAIQSDLFDTHGFYSHLKKKLGSYRTERVLDSFLSMSPRQFKNSRVFRSTQRSLEIPSSAYLDFLEQIVGDKHEGLASRTRAHETLTKISEKVDYNFLYLPTFRRVEQDFRELGIGDLDAGLEHDDSINFGMADVDKKIKEITQEILTSSVEWFSKVNGEMLSQLVEGFNLDQSLKASIKDPATIKIVLDRIGNNINEDYKNKILELIETGEIFSNHDPLIYFIANLSKVYEQQKENDNCIQEFTDVCNRYLGDKKLIYNESSVTVDIVRKKNNRSVSMEKLSSGEKQIISLFAKLYLQKEENIAIFFDEPELSLSMEWQKTLLPDILNSGRCSFLFTTTHSPFIFENDLVNNTTDLATFITEL